MGKRFAERLAALEALERDQDAPLYDFTFTLLRGYGTLEDMAAWEAAGCPPVSRAEIETVLREVYDDEEL